MMKIQCLIERDGPTTVQYAGIRYDFVRNEHDAFVCEVVGQGAANHFLGLMGGQFYREYAEPVEEEGGEAATDAPLEEPLEEPTEEIAEEVAETPVEEVAEGGTEEPAEEFTEGVTEEVAEPMDQMLARYEAYPTKNALVAAAAADFEVVLTIRETRTALLERVTQLIHARFEVEG